MHVLIYLHHPAHFYLFKHTIRKLKAEPSLSSTRVVGFFSHVRLDIRDAAKAAGCDVILPRSAIVSALSGLISGNATGRQDEP
jgi:hypothetical protein